jgi:hypothetical protein
MRRGILTLLALLAAAPLFADAISVVTYSTSGGGSGGATVTGTNAFTGANSFLDASFSLLDNSDPTKILQFQSSTIGTGTTRTATMPNANITLAGINLAQSFSADQTINSGIFLNINGRLSFVGSQLFTNASQTPDTLTFGLDAVGNTLILVENADVAFDFAHALETDPTLIVHSTNQSTTQFARYTHLGQAPNPVTVTVDAATTFAITTGSVILACTGAETINTITGGKAGMILILENSDTECTIADDDAATAANAVDLIGTATNDVGAVAKMLLLYYNGTHWLQLTESDN